MRILAIRGKNLASLAHEFEVDFSQEPLASAGLFAITGPTGAGKSTLLDALCLALYDDTPRLVRATAKGINLPDVGEETIAPRDPRSILRRSAAEGYAEVDFAGNDGVAYRARWSVRRARSRPDGRLQASEMSLLRIADSHPVASHLKTEVLAEIQRRIGLNFAQFTRAVLLAQNDFAAFLKASDDERAELLQTLTGTDLFSDISRRAFERQKTEKEQLQRQLEQLADQKPLEAEDRARLEGERREKSAALEEMEKRRAELEGRLRWHQAWEQAKAAEGEAQAAVARALAAQAGAAPRLAYFRRVEAVQPARPLVAEKSRLAAELAEGRLALAQAGKALAEGRQAQEEGEKQAQAAGQAVQQAEAARAGAAPDLARARELDTQIQLLAPAQAKAARERQEAQAAVARAEAARRGKEEEGRQAEAERQKLERWLEANAGLRPLAEAWVRWDGLLAEAATLQGETLAQGREVARLRQEEAAKGQALAAAQARQARADQEVEESRRKLEAAGTAVARFNGDTLAARRQALESRRDRFQEGERLWSDLAAREARHQQLATRLKEAEGALAASRHLLAAARAAKPAAAAALAQAEKSLSLTEAACHAGVEQLRSTLEPDNPCPVCGSLEHPYAGGDGKLRAVLDGLRAEARRCREEMEALARQEAAQEQAVTSGDRQLAQLREELAVLAGEVANDRQRWAAHPLAAEIGNDLFGGDWLAQQIKAVKGDLEILARDEEAFREALRQQEAVRLGMEQAAKVQTTAREAVAAAQLAHQQAVQALAAAVRRQEDVALRLQERLGDLGAAFPDPAWRDAWLADPASFHRARREEAEAWTSRQKSRGELEGRSTAIAAELKGLSQGAADAAAALQKMEAAFQAADGDLKEKQATRRGLLGGRPVAEVEGELERAVAAARQVLDARQQALQQAATGLARATEALGQVSRMQLDREKAQAASEAALAAWLAEFNGAAQEQLDAASLLQLLAHDTAWLTAERQALQALDTAVETARAVFKERQGARLQQESARPGPEEATALAEALEKLREELEAAKARATALDIELARDDERRQKSAALLAGIQEQEARARLWGQMNELIGSESGKKFRNFAQQMTLDVLLGYANRHLETLSRRYRLERVKDTLALLVVDQDMGGEIRSVHSLSGGESFLLSLALALGLASLSSHQVRVESLFIDEGFGSLDADALRVAMEALDSLQAQGRKVGVISHVQEMTERIGTQIQVRRQAGGQSRLAVSGG